MTTFDELWQQNHVSLTELAEHTPLETTTYLTIGGGLGSFTWVDYLLINGVSQEQIVAIGFEDRPHGRFRTLCTNSQIPDHERLRSNSDSCPDNIWGWPSYGAREMWRTFTRGQWRTTANVGWRLFNEPFVETYTPIAGDVYAAIDREAQRIGWDDMWRRGRVRGIRKTKNGRYAVAYSNMNENRSSDHRIIVCDYLHVAVGYPGARFLPDLQDYRARTNDHEHVVNAYEKHDHVYDALQAHGGTLLLRGRGIVASRVLQRIDEVRATTDKPIKVTHLIRMPHSKGNHYEHANRTISNHWEFQPFNWPKAAWGGDLRETMQDASPSERKRLLETWGGTTTADRQSWRELVERGLQEGWYQIVFGSVDNVARKNGRLRATLKTTTDGSHPPHLEANYIIDATGLEADIHASPLLNDLITQYNLPLNPEGRLAVDKHFELVALRNNTGRVYASGIITLGSHYAPVDSFLGLQFAASQITNQLTEEKSPGLRPMHSARSASQWTRWALGARP